MLLSYHCSAAAVGAAVEDIKNSYRAALDRGLPYPIIYTLEFFRVDEGGFVWQRSMRSAGHFTYIIFWSVHHFSMKSISHCHCSVIVIISIVHRQPWAALP